MSLAACGGGDNGSEDDGGGTTPPSVTADLQRTATIDASTTYQTIVGFGASDCWDGNYVGKWSDSNRKAIAELLFDKEKGIGLSMWRFNLGAGTAEQGDTSNITSKERRSECFMRSNGTYNWNQQAGQQYFLEQAKSYGVEHFVMFSNSAPVFMNNNNRGYSNSGAYSNLKADRYDDFAEFIATVVDHFKSTGINFEYVSPVNESQYNWDGHDQEGSGWQNKEVAALARHIDASLASHSLSTQILLAECASWQAAYEQTSDAARSNVINDFFTAGSSDYIGNLSHLAKVIAGHSYWIDSNWDQLKTTRTQLATRAAATGITAWQTEWSMLGDGYNDSDFPGYDNATYMDIALYMSKVINADLTIGNVTSWSYWTAMATERYSQKDRFMLINVVPGDGAYGDIEKNGTYKAMKTLWTLGNYSRFIRPGYKRISLAINETTGSSILGSAFISPDGKTTVEVYSNYSSKSIAMTSDVKNGGTLSTVKTYTTSASESLTEQDAKTQSTVLIPAKSVVTVLRTYK